MTLIIENLPLPTFYYGQSIRADLTSWNEKRISAPLFLAQFKNLPE